MELEALTNAIVAGVPLMIVVIGFVQFVKEKLNWSGWGVEVFAIVFGLIVGFAYQVYLAAAGDGLKWDFVFIFPAIIYGLMVGLVATGIYKVYANEQE